MELKFHPSIPRDVWRDVRVLAHRHYRGEIGPIISVLEPDHDMEPIGPAEITQEELSRPHKVLRFRLKPRCVRRWGINDVVGYDVEPT